MKYLRPLSLFEQFRLAHLLALVLIGLIIPVISIAEDAIPDGFYTQNYNPCKSWTAITSDNGFHGYSCSIWPNQVTTLDADNAINWIKYLKTEVEALKSQVKDLKEKLKVSEN